MKIKICGLCREEDIDYVISQGVDYLGIILFPGSKRFVELNRAKRLISNLDKVNVYKVAVTVNPPIDYVYKILDAGFDLIQLHGDETLEFAQNVGMDKVIKAFRVGKEPPYIEEGWKKAHAILLDTYKKGQYGGTGETFNWNIAKYIKKQGFRILLSGGLNPQNVIQAIEEVKPFGVDVSSGVEDEPCKKSKMLVDEFIKKVRSVSV